MTSENPTAVPNSVAKALLAFWIAWVVALASGLYPELRLIYDHMEALKAENPFQASVALGLALAVPFLLLTPKFIGSTVAAVMLLLVARRKGWSRWVLLIGLVASGAALTVSVLATPNHRASSSQLGLLALSCLAYLVMVVALAQFFGSEASMWFGQRASKSKNKAPQRDVA